MSRRALLIAARNQMRLAVGSGGLAFATKDCEIAPIRGMPPPLCGDRFIGVWAGPRTATGIPNAGLDEIYSLNVTVTARVNGRVPIDLTGPRLLDFALGFDDLVDSIRCCLDIDQKDHRVGILANAIIETGYSAPLPTGFHTALHFLGDDGWTPVTGEWFSAPKETGIRGLICNMQFGKARRTQSYHSTNPVT